MAFVPTNFAKAVLIIILAFFTFTKLSTKEWVFLLVMCIIFTALNIPAVMHGIFVFNDPDFFGLPVYEFLAWGFYLLHTKRLLEGPVPQGNRWLVLSLVVLFALSFALIVDTSVLLIASLSVLVISVIVFHEPMDLVYMIYFLFLGTLIEYTGVMSGQWHYFGPTVAGVPLWYIPLWAGVGLFLRRFILPFFRDEMDVKQPHIIRTSK